MIQTIMHGIIYEHDQAFHEELIAHEEMITVVLCFGVNTKHQMKRAIGGIMCLAKASNMK